MQKKDWDSKKCLSFIRNHVKFNINVPTYEDHYCHKWEVDFKEKSQEKITDGLKKLYNEHRQLYIAYNQKVTRPNQS